MNIVMRAHSDASGVIVIHEQHEVGDHMGADYLATLVCDTRDRAIREELIKLGWTPPNEVSG